MNELQVWNYNNEEVRTIEKGGEPWWVLKDVCDVLAIGNSRDVTARLDEDEKDVDIIDTLGGKQELTVISEGGLYNVILLSRKPEAKKFKRWVTHEVLPSIRKHGVYATDNFIENALLNPEFGIRALQELKNEREQRKLLESENAVQKQLICEMKPKADYVDYILKNPGLVTINQIAKDYGISGRRLNGLLHESGIQYKQGDQWLLYAKYQDRGYTQSETIDITRADGRSDIALHTKWTQKGRLFLHEFLKQREIYPNVEKL